MKVWIALIVFVGILAAIMINTKNEYEYKQSDYQYIPPCRAVIDPLQRESCYKLEGTY